MPQIAETKNESDDFSSGLQPYTPYSEWLMALMKKELENKSENFEKLKPLVGDHILFSNQSICVKEIYFLLTNFPVEALHFMNSTIDFDDNGAALVEALSQSTSLTSFNLAGSGYTASAVTEVIAIVLQQNCSLCSVYLQGCSINSDALKSLADALKNNTHLKSLSLIKCNVTPEVENLLVQLEDHNYTLTSLTVLNADTEHPLTPGRLDNFQTRNKEIQALAYAYYMVFCSTLTRTPLVSVLVGLVKDYLHYLGPEDFMEMAIADKKKPATNNSQSHTFSTSVSTPIATATPIEAVMEYKSSASVIVSAIAGTVRAEEAFTPSQSLIAGQSIAETMTKVKSPIAPAPTPRTTNDSPNNYNFLLNVCKGCLALSIGCFVTAIALAIFMTPTAAIAVLCAIGLVSGAASFGFFKMSRCYQPTELTVGMAPAIS